MGFATSLVYTLYFFSFLSLTLTITAQSFRCTSGGTCNAIIEYVTPNATTLSAIKTLFNVKNLRSILGVNNLPLSTSPNQTFPVGQKTRIPFPCRCFNGTGMSFRKPVYKVVPGDGLFHIASEVFAGLVLFPQIQAVNNIPDANLITVGQRLWIPLPCSCDDVDGQKVVHYGHVVASGSTVSRIAQQFNSSEQTLMRINRLASPNDLKAGTVLDVPLRACMSSVVNNSLDYPLLVPNGTYGFTATNCVMCKCDAANNWILKCEPSQIKSSLWSSCPSMQCRDAENLVIGNVTSSSNCNRTCSYAGYTNQTILTTLATCPGPANSAKRFGLQVYCWSLLLVSVHLVLFSLHLFQR